MSVEMKIKGLMIDPVSNMPIIVLKNGGYLTLRIGDEVNPQTRVGWMPAVDSSGSCRTPELVIFGVAAAYSFA